MAHRESFIASLENAYAMENALIPILQNHANDGNDHFAAQARIQESVEKIQARRHADVVCQAWSAWAKAPSTVKSGLLGTMQAPAT